ncbi:hypothetical protein Aduo_009265 [Ancylostoma duodenale]
MDLKICRPKKVRPRANTQLIKWWRLEEQKDNVLPFLLSCLTTSAERTVEGQWNTTMNATRNSVVGVWGRTTPDKTKIEKATRCWNEEVQSKIAQKKFIQTLDANLSRGGPRCLPGRKAGKRNLLSQSPNTTKNCTTH